MSATPIAVDPIRSGATRAAAELEPLVALYLAAAQAAEECALAHRRMANVPAGVNGGQWFGLSCRAEGALWDAQRNLARYNAALERLRAARMEGFCGPLREARAVHTTMVAADAYTASATTAVEVQAGPIPVTATIGARADRTRNP